MTSATAGRSVPDLEVAMSVHRSRPAVLAAVCMALTMATAGGAQSQQAPVEQFEGTLVVVWGDPHPDLGAGGVVRHSLVLRDGRVFPVQLPGPASAAASHV